MNGLSLVMPMKLEESGHDIKQHKRDDRMNGPRCDLRDIKGWHGDLRWKGRRLWTLLKACDLRVSARKSPWGDRLPNVPGEWMGKRNGWLVT